MITYVNFGAYLQIKRLTSFATTHYMQWHCNQCPQKKKFPKVYHQKLRMTVRNHIDTLKEQCHCARILAKLPIDSPVSKSVLWRPLISLAGMVANAIILAEKKSSRFFPACKKVGIVKTREFT